MGWYRCGGGGITSDEVNATKANVLAGKTALTSDSNDEVATGTMPNNGSMDATLGFGGSKIIPSGYTSGGTVNVSITDRRGWASGVGVGGTTYIPEGYHNGNGYVYGPSDGNLVAGNIRNGATIFGVSGNVRGFGQLAGSAYTNGSRDFWNSSVSRWDYRPSLELAPSFTPMGMWHWNVSQVAGDHGMYTNSSFLMSGMENFEYTPAAWTAGSVIVPVIYGGSYSYGVTGYY